MSILDWVGLSVVAFLLVAGAIQCVAISRRKEIHVFHHTIPDIGVPEEDSVINTTNVSPVWDRRS